MQMFSLFQIQGLKQLFSTCEGKEMPILRSKTISKTVLVKHFTPSQDLGMVEDVSILEHFSLEFGDFLVDFARNSPSIFILHNASFCFCPRLIRFYFILPRQESKTVDLI